jgi:ribonucleoside-triphosphate reductase
MDISVLNHPAFKETTTPLQVRKRDGATLQTFDAHKIECAIKKAWEEAEGKVDDARVRQVVALAVNTLSAEVADVEQIQDAVEIALMKFRHFAVARAYIVYREKHAERRQLRRRPDPLAVSEYIHQSKYARHIPAEMRRELYHETVTRVREMHRRKFAHVEGLDADIVWAFDQVLEKRVLPSMRSMQFGGAAVEAVNNRIYNCTFSFIDRPRVFAEAMFLLLCGSGVGYSVQFEHVEKLPALKFVDTDNVVHHTVADSIEGWADALYALVMSYVEGYNIEFNYSLVRKKGTPLKTSGGKAPGHRRLKESLEQVRKILDGAQGRKLRPIECHDIMCHAADAVLSGGIRRSAMICLFSLDDSEMVNAKSGNWYPKHPWRENANNSVMLKRDEVKKKQFKRIIQMTKEWGEPGFYFCSDFDYGTNPCAEIGLNPKIVVDDALMNQLAQRADRGKPVPDVKMGDVVTGWGFCNLCEINAAMFKTAEDFEIGAKAAAIIGTLQAAYTDMAYLGWASEVIAEREALLGIGMTGMLDASDISCDPVLQREMALKIKQWNAETAARIGIRPAARTTCVKPSGTTSLELGCVGSGHHAHHARRYIRRVTADELETVFQAFKAVNPHMCVKKPNGKWVVEFPVEAPAGAMLKEDLTALTFLDMVRSTQQNWVLPGTADTRISPGLAHNVSNTVHVRADEWDEVAEYIWNHREFFTGISLIAATGDKDYAFAPNEAVVTEADEARYNQLITYYKPVDYTTVLEVEDGTNLTGEVACANGLCEVKF